MRAVRLTASAKQLLRSASREPIEDYFVTLAPQQKRSRWLPQANRYRVRCTSQYSEDLSAQPHSVDHVALTQYVAASAPAHVIDGWSILGRAVESALRGDTYAAIHFGYYAELRAAMSLLACEGIGIFDKAHPVVRGNGTTVRLPNADFRRPNTQQYSSRPATTHAIIWPVLRHWSALQRSGDLLSQVVRPNAILLSEWLNACNAMTPARALGRRWLLAWGTDLSVFEGDRNARNLASYRPSGFRSPPAVPAERTVEFVEELWRLFEPSNGARFPRLEALLLRRALQSAHGAQVNQAAIENLGFAAGEAAQWVTFLADRNEPIALTAADNQLPIEDSDCHFGVISRAALLLFLATAATRRLLANGNYTSATLDFWWKARGVSHGLWEAGAFPDHPFDAWADIAGSLQSSRSWRDNAGGAFSLRAWRRGSLEPLDDLGAFDLIAMWGLMP